MINESGPFRFPDEHDERDRLSWRRRQQARDCVARANAEAAHSARWDAGMDPTDPRWVFAVRTQTQLEGAILIPERREKLLRLATQLGLSRFDASVIISLVQDQARRHGSLADASAAIALVPPPATHRERSNAFEWCRWTAAIACAAMAAVLMARWISAAQL